jgi:phage terminase Nu1 subunit (DNA packaging protein)
MKKHETKPSPSSLHGARTRKEIALADLRELEVKRRRGALLDAEETARAWEGTMREVRAALLAVPSRCRARCPEMTATMIATVDEEIRSALVALANGGDNGN